MRIVLIIIFIFIGIGCNRVKYNDSEVDVYRVEIFEDRNPKFIIDSISKADTIKNITTEFNKWNKAMNQTNENKQTTFYFYDDKTKTVISIFQYDNKYIIKHTKGL